MESEARKRRIAERKEYIRSKKNVPCHDCGRNFPSCCMDFHHLDETEKHPYISRYSLIQRMAKFSIKKIDEEISKCVIVCACCHRIRHNQEEIGT